ncbi:hypothetical protein ACSSK1_01845 [Escherichia coli]|uniref:hypothetical protein n=1 Tax=Escherichia coli TaxID=562 RepID=UPI003FD6543B
MKNNTQPALKERIEKALEDFTKGRASMHVPPLDTDVDVVLAECSDRLSELKARCAALAAENAGLKAAFDKPQAYLSWHTIQPTWEDPLPCGEYLDVHDDAGHKNSDGTDCWPVYAKPEINTPVTDAFLAEVRAQAHKEGAHFVANRMLAAWEAGFIEDTAKNAADIARMILTSTEFMDDAPEGDFDRSFADGVLEDIAAQIRKGDAQ